ncbi:hypothetical protein [Streptomyces sp. PU_AKi4]|uniref:hypothetical protein n=1 Tax=Streptomyces sp. PU_AKi4 TaxID=2800809 RepID=UPI0035243004
MRPGEGAVLGVAFPRKAGSVAQISLARERPEYLHEVLRGAGFAAGTIAGVRW